MAAAALADERPKPAAVGDKVAAADQLRDVRGGRRPLTGFAGHKAVVLAFVGADCPVSNLYLPGLIELEKKYRAKDVLFLAVYPNEPEDVDQVGRARRRPRRAVPRPQGLRRRSWPTPSASPASRPWPSSTATCKLKYRGRVDDQYGVAAKRPKATRADLAEALAEVVAGKTVTTRRDGGRRLPDRRGPRSRPPGRA